MHICVPQKACTEKSITIQLPTGNNLKPISRIMDKQSNGYCRPKYEHKNLNTKACILCDPTHLSIKTESVFACWVGQFSLEMTDWKGLFQDTGNVLVFI